MSRDAQDFARETSAIARRMRGLTRRMRIRSSSGAVWQVTGHRVMGNLEAPELEPFTGVGFYSRPRPTSKADAIVITVGDAKHQVIIATRDEDLRKLWRTELDAGADVAAMFNSATIVLCKPDGTVEIRSRGGTAHRLAKASELQALATAFYGHGHFSNGSPPTATFDPMDPPLEPPDPLGNPGQPGTDVLKGE